MRMQGINMTKIKNKVIAIIALIILVLATCGFSAPVALADIVTYSNVLDDLKKDDNFKESYYPEKSNDYGLQIIQLAESTGKELFIYVYQPSGQAKNLSASSINISTSKNDEINFKNYKLKLCNSSGVFFKYAVMNFEVLSEETRYYAISSIYRPFDETIDKQADHDNKVTEVNFEVGKQYCFSTINGKPYVAVVEIETITITDKFVGLVRYSDGYKFYPGKGACDSHFVAFNTDKRIEKLLEADVYYTAQSYSKKKFGNKSDKYAYLKYTDKVEHNGGGLFAGTYKWDRIETVEQFLKENDLTQNVYSGAIIDVTLANKITDEGKQALKGKKWLLRFTETAYTKAVLPGTFGSVYEEDLTLVGDVTILRLKFETDGITYNLGTIDNKQTGSGKPINDETLNVSLEAFWIYGVIIIVVLFIALIAVRCLDMFAIAGNGILMLISMVINITLESISGMFKFLKILLPYFKYVTIFFAVLTVIFVIVEFVKTIRGK